MPKKKVILFFVAVIYSLVLIYFSLANADAALPNHKIPYQDKWLHLLSYIILAFVWGLFSTKSYKRKALLTSFLCTLVFGILLESIQETINPTRTTDLFDGLANVVGVVIGTVIVYYYQNNKDKII